jgi:hypothetical protein
LHPVWIGFILSLFCLPPQGRFCLPPQGDFWILWLNIYQGGEKEGPPLFTTKYGFNRVQEENEEMNCDFCRKEYEEKDMGLYKGQHVCFKCATDRGIPADFTEFLSENPDSYDEDAIRPVKKVKDPGNIVLAFLISAVFAGAAAYLWIYNPLHLGEYKTAVYLAAGILTGLLVRLLQKGRGSSYQNVTGILIMIAFFIPQLMILHRDGSFELLSLMKDFMWLLGAVFACYLFLVEMKKKSDK